MVAVEDLTEQRQEYLLSLGKNSQDLATRSIQMRLALGEVSPFKVSTASQTVEYGAKIRPLLSRHDSEVSTRTFALRGHRSYKVSPRFLAHSDFGACHVSHPPIPYVLAS